MLDATGAKELRVTTQSGSRRSAAMLVAAVVLLQVACAPSSPPDVTIETVGGGAPSGADASASPSHPRPAPTQTRTAGSLEAPALLASDLEAPWSIAFLDGGGALVSERDSGALLEVRPDGATARIASIAGIAAGGEGGLLGIAVHDGHLYWYATTAADNRVMRTRLSGTSGALELGQPELVLGGIPRAGNHNGGRIAFGPDGMLYATTGDAGVPSRAQDASSLAGKILRLAPDGSIPSDNPDPGSPVYSLGHRNPQGIAWTPDGTLFATEFGQDTWDELNVIVPGGNYGWPAVEGIVGGGSSHAGFIDPVQQWSPREASPSGMAFADGSLWIANLRGRSLRQVDVADPSTSRVHWLDEFGRMRDVAAAPDGSLWVLTGNTDGRGEPADGDDRILTLMP
jgi:glucose/arabinose dehydrogenase